jgi:hypothetical protein
MPDAFFRQFFDSMGEGVAEIEKTPFAVFLRIP